MSKDFRFSLRSTDRAQAERPEAAHIKAASGRRKEMLREEVFQKATDGRPYSCFAEHYGQEYSECDAGKERAKQIAGRFFPGRRGVCFMQEGRIADEGGNVSQTGMACEEL